MTFREYIQIRLSSILYVRNTQKTHVTLTYDLDIQHGSRGCRGYMLLCLYVCMDPLTVLRFHEPGETESYLDN